MANFLPSFLVWEEDDHPPPLLLFSRGERQRPWPLSLLPSRMGMSMVMTTLPPFSGIEGQRPWPLLKRGMGMAMATLLTFSGIEGQRSLPLAHLPSRCGMGMTMTPLLFFSRGERQRPWPPAPLLLEEAEVMATCPPSLSMWDEGDLDPNPPFPQEERGRDHGLFPSFLLEEGWAWP